MTIKNVSVCRIGGEPYFMLTKELELVTEAAFVFAQYQQSKIKDPEDPLCVSKKLKSKSFVKEFEEKGDIMLIKSDNYHIEEGIFLKMNHVYQKLFKDYNRLELLDKDEIKAEVMNEVGEIRLIELINENLDEIKQLLDNTLSINDNLIKSYALTSSNNTILCCFKENEIEEIEKNLSYWALEHIPVFEKKTSSLVYNTGIHFIEEPYNDILLYFFGESEGQGLDDFYMETFTKDAPKQLAKIIKKNDHRFNWMEI